MPQLDVLKYDNLFAGDFDVVTEPVLIAAGQTIKRGDLLEKLVTESIAVEGAAGTVTRTVAASYAKVSAASTEESFYAIAAEDVTTTESTATIIGYKSGIYNENEVGFGGTATADNCRDILAAKSIYLTKAKPQ